MKAQFNTLYVVFQALYKSNWDKVIMYDPSMSIDSYIDYV